MQFTMIRRSVALAAATSLFASTAEAQVSLGQAGNYTVVGTGTRIAMNSGPVVGDVLLGQAIQAAFSGGGNGEVTGILYYDNTVTGTNTFTQLDTPPTTQLVSTTITLQAQFDAAAASLAAESLPVTQTFGALSGSVTINGNGGLNVINIASLHNATVTINASPGDTFIFNVTGNFSTNRPFILNGGVSGANLLFNLLGTSGNIFQTSGGNTLFGTFLSTRGGNFQFSNLNLTGALINTGGEMSIVSGSHVTYERFTPQAGGSCTADFNHDGTINSTDISDFINQWFQDQVEGTLLTDWDENGVVNSTDVSDFINQWLKDIAAGCV